MLRGVAAYLRLHHLGLLALFVALGGTSFAAAGVIRGTQIAPHSIPKNRLTNGAIKSLKGGRGAQGVPGAQGAQGPPGAKGATGSAGHAGPTGHTGATGHVGPTGHAGPTGPTGVVGTGTLNGGIAPAIANSNIYVFAGPTLSVTTTASQRLVGSAVALLGSSGGTNIWYGLCYKPSTSSTLQNWAGVDYLETPVGARQAFSVSASVAPGAGTFTVGFCVKNNGASNLDDNNWVNGWVEVVNATALG